MRIGLGVTPLAEWTVIRDAAVEADHAGLDSVFLWDHYHSAKPEWGYVAGWSALGAIASVTSSVRVAPMVLNSLHYELGVVAKESSVLSVLSGGRFELGIGAGDWPSSFAAWGSRYPPRGERIARLGETVDALRRLWSGEPVTSRGTYVNLDGAICTPAPPEPPRVIVGAGASAALAELAAEIADEVNVYPEPDSLARARQLVEGSGRSVTLSVHVDWSWASWPAHPASALRALRDAGVDRAFVAAGGPEMRERVQALAGANA